MGEWDSVAVYNRILDTLDVVQMCLIRYCKTPLTFLQVGILADLWFFEKKNCLHLLPIYFYIEEVRDCLMLNFENQIIIQDVVVI